LMQAGAKMFPKGVERTGGGNVKIFKKRRGGPEEEKGSLELPFSERGVTRVTGEKCKTRGGLRQGSGSFRRKGKKTGCPIEGV